AQVVSAVGKLAELDLMAIEELIAAHGVLSRVLVPTLRVGTHAWPLCGPCSAGSQCAGMKVARPHSPQSGDAGVPTRSVGTRGARGARTHIPRRAGAGV